MKTIVVAGGGRHVGKTTLCRRLKELLEGAVSVKLGTHAARDDKPEAFLPRGTPYPEVLKSVGDPDFLIIESGKMLDDPLCVPDLVVFLPAPSGRTDKPGSESRRARADMVRGEEIGSEGRDRLMQALGVDEPTFVELEKLVGVPTADR